jgi:hypothetical protein
MSHLFDIIFWLSDIFTKGCLLFIIIGWGVSLIACGVGLLMWIYKSLKELR